MTSALKDISIIYSVFSLGTALTVNNKLNSQRSEKGVFHHISNTSDIVKNKKNKKI